MVKKKKVVYIQKWCTTGAVHLYVILIQDYPSTAKCHRRKVGPLLINTDSDNYFLIVVIYFNRIILCCQQVLHMLLHIIGTVVEIYLIWQFSKEAPRPLSLQVFRGVLFGT